MLATQVFPARLFGNKPQVIPGPWPETEKDTEICLILGNATADLSAS
jgi:hypothetical protein